jgi:hypothetical protein
LSRIISICALLLAGTIIQAQSTNYLKLRNHLEVDACGMSNPDIVMLAIATLDRIDTAQITKNLHHYYLDMAQLYWLASGIGDSTYLHKCIASCRRALYHDPSFAPAHWNIAMAYSQLQDCEAMQKHLDLCFEYTKDKEIDEYTIQQAEEMITKCKG